MSRYADLDLTGWRLVDGVLHNSRGRASTSSKYPSGYVCSNVRGRLVPYHHLVWFFHYGYWAKEIDHINRVRDDNRIENLREVDRSLNNLNTKTRKDNTSGHKGVYFVEQANRWQACIVFRGRRKTANFKSKEAAIEQRIKWEKELHENHFD